MFWSQLLKILIILFNLQSLPLLRIDFTGPSSSIPWRETFFFVAFNLLLAARTINSSCPLVFFNSIVKSPITSAANNDIYYFNIKKKENIRIFFQYRKVSIDTFYTWMNILTEIPIELSSSSYQFLPNLAHQLVIGFHAKQRDPDFHYNVHHIVLENRWKKIWIMEKIAEIK